MLTSALHTMITRWLWTARKPKGLCCRGYSRYGGGSCCLTNRAATQAVKVLQPLWCRNNCTQTPLNLNFVWCAILCRIPTRTCIPTRTHAHAHRLSAIQPGKRRRPHYSHPPSTYPLPRRKTQTRWHELWQPQALLQKAAATMQASHYQISCNQPQGYLWYCSARNVRAHLRQHVLCLSMYPWKFKYTNEIN